MYKMFFEEVRYTTKVKHMREYKKYVTMQNIPCYGDLKSYSSFLISDFYTEKRFWKTFIVVLWK